MPRSGEPDEQADRLIERYRSVARPKRERALRCVHALVVRTQNIAQKAGPFSVARLEMDPPFHDRLAYNRVSQEKRRPS